MSDNVDHFFGGSKRPIANSGSSFALDDDQEVLVKKGNSGSDMSSSNKSSNKVDPKTSILKQNFKNFGDDMGGSSQKRKIMPLIPKKMSTSGKMLVLLIRILILGYTAVILFGEVILISSEKSKWCSQYDPKFDYVNAGIDPEYINKGGSSDHHVIEYSDDDDTNSTGKHYENPDYNTDPCRYERVPYLLYLTPEECDLCRRMLASVVFGGIIGYERRASDRPAGK